MGLPIDGIFLRPSGMFLRFCNSGGIYLRTKSGGIYLRTYRNSGGMNLHPDSGGIYLRTYRNSGGIILHPNYVPTVPCIVHTLASIFIQYTSRYLIRYISPL